LRLSFVAVEVAVIEVPTLAGSRFRLQLYDLAAWPKLTPSVDAWFDYPVADHDDPVLLDGTPVIGAVAELVGPG
jgi:hypothetical protein